MAFRISDAFAKLIAGWGLDRDELAKEADRIAGQFPDIADQERAFVEWATPKIDTALDPVNLANTLRGAWRDLMEKGFVADPQAFTGNV